MGTAADMNRFAGGCAYIDGDYCPTSEAKISIFDMGMTRSDCTYDVVGVWDGRFFRLDDHLDRFMRSVSRLRLDIGMTRDELESVLHGCVSRAGLQRAYVSMTCTRGRPAPGNRDLRTCRNNLYCFAVPYIWVSPEDVQAVGASMWISDMPASSAIPPMLRGVRWVSSRVLRWASGSLPSASSVARTSGSRDLSRCQIRAVWRRWAWDQACGRIQASGSSCRAILGQWCQATMKESRTALRAAGRSPVSA